MRPYRAHRGGRPVFVDSMGLGECRCLSKNPRLLAANVFHFVRVYTTTQR